MSGSIRKWMVLGALASGSLLFAACEDRDQGINEPGTFGEVRGGEDELQLGAEEAGLPEGVEPEDEQWGPPGMERPVIKGQEQGFGGAGQGEAEQVEEEDVGEREQRTR